ncbi:O-antigen ligase family protein [Paenibacillus sp. OV219]|uniref:O-antigen ligase family protein n=1 Tax=Paenibacillus sp. OV219 TaxID=1884377 RepID=UPI0008AEBDC2|nr:O-antigen ligase family protein [Paenibacillus sp. OV219]SEP12843.1 O-antigen ligase [Paenibacillus sp. OV219]
MNFVIVIVLAAVLLVGGFRQGLFFDSDFYGAAIVVAGLFVVASAASLWRRRWTWSGVNGWQALLALLLPAAYAASLLHAENAKATVDQIVRFTSYGCFFLLLRGAMARAEAVRKLLPGMLQACGVVFGVAAWLGYAGWLQSAGTVVAGRMAGTLQYPNAFGAISAALLLFALLQLAGSSGNYRSSLGVRLLQAVPLGVHASGLLLSQSRGALLAAAVAWLFACALLPLARQLLLSAATLAALACASAAAALLPPPAAMAAAPSAAAPLLLAAATLAAAWLGAAAVRGIASSEAAPRFARIAAHPAARLAVPAGALAFAVLTALDLMQHGLLYASLPASWQQSIAALAQTGTLRERFIMLQDALAIVRTSPLIGHGGGSWRILFTQVQHTPYESGEIHNGWVEWLVSTGLLGFTAFISILAVVFTALLRQWRRKPEEPITLAAMAALLLILVHSCTDFDFAFGYVWLVLIGLVAAALPPVGESSIVAAAAAAAAPHAPVKAVTAPIWQRGVKLAHVLIALAVCFSAAASLRADDIYGRLTDDTDSGDAVDILDQSLALDPLNALRELQLAGVHAVRYAQQSSDLADEAAATDRALQRAIELQPHDASLLQHSAAIYEQAGAADKALRLYEQASQLDPFNAALYGEAAKLRLNNAVLTEQGDAAQQYELLQAFQHYERNRDVLAQFQARMPEADWHAFNGRGLRIEPAAAYYGAIAAYMLGSNEEAAAAITSGDFQGNAELATEAKALHIVVLRKLGDQEQADKLYKDGNGASSTLDEYITTFESLVSTKD